MMWNSLDLKRPIDDAVPYPPQDHYLTEALRDFVTVLSTAANTLTSENPLWSELEVLRNIQQKYKRLLHCDKCLIFLQRVGHCIKKMVLLHLSKSYLDLAERFLIGFQGPSMTLLLPSRQQLEYILIRTLTATKLVCEGIKYSRETFCFLIQKLKVGHLILDLVMAASVIARLNILLRATLEQLCTVYHQTVSWRYKIKKGEFKWESRLDLPHDLTEWLKSFESGCLEPFPMSLDDVNALSKLLTQKDEDKDSDAESVVLLNEVEVTTVESTSVSNGNQVMDYGEVVPRKKKKSKAKGHELTSLQKSLLQKIVQTQSLRNLEKMWKEIFNLPEIHFPRALTEMKRRVIKGMFTKIRNTVPTTKYLKEFTKEPPFLKTAQGVFCKHLGFTREDVEMCRNELRALQEAPKSPAEVSTTDLVPVKKFKDLEKLFLRLSAILEDSNQTREHKKLCKKFKQRAADIKLLKENGEKNTAKKLIFCTSKVLLTLCSETISKKK